MEPERWGWRHHVGVHIRGAATRRERGRYVTCTSTSTSTRKRRRVCKRSGIALGFEHILYREINKCKLKLYKIIVSMIILPQVVFIHDKVMVV